MTTNERFIAIARAGRSVLEKIDAVLEGRDTEIRTCTYSEAADRIGVSRPTVYKLVKTGKIRTVDICGGRRIIVSSLEDLVLG